MYMYMYVYIHVYIYIYMDIQCMLNEFSVDFVIEHIEMKEQIIITIS